MELCACGREKEHRGAAFDPIKCKECRADYARYKPECANFTVDDWKKYVQAEREKAVAEFAELVMEATR